MGLLDSLYLAFFGGTFLMTLILLIISIKKTDDEVKKAAYRRTYMPFITCSAVMLILYIGIVSIGNITVNLMN